MRTRVHGGSILEMSLYKVQRRIAEVPRGDAPQHVTGATDAPDAQRWGLLCGVALGAAALGAGLAALLFRRPPHSGVPHTSNVWDETTYKAADGVDGLRLRTPLTAENPQGVDVMLELWEAGTSEPPHSHSGDDVTIVVDGEMHVQFYDAAGRKDGTPLVLRAGDAGHIKGGRIHDARYVTACKLAYVHAGEFSFVPLHARQPVS